MKRNIFFGKVRNVSSGFLILVPIAIFLRLLFFLLNHTFDFLNILVISKSVAETGSVIPGFFVLKRIGLEVQLYGKLFYQLAARWLTVLDTIGLVSVIQIFDNKPFIKDKYMELFLQSNPALFQLMSIKFIQVLYDILFLYFLVRLAQLFNKEQSKTITLFWAINPFILFVTYGMFQSDIAMLALFTGSVYFATRAITTPIGGEKYKYFALVLLALGAVIKQGPLLLLPFLFIAFSQSFISLILYVVVFFGSYSIFFQGWSSDAAIIRQFFLHSTESMALFNFTLNDTSVFMFSYLVILYFVYTYRKNIFSKVESFVLISVAVLTLVYLTRDISFLFFQLNVWIMPFLAIASLRKNIYSFFLIAPVIGYLKRTLVDSDAFVGSLATLLGARLGSIPTYEDLIKPFIEPLIIHYALNSLMALLYVVLFYIVAVDLLDKSSLKKLNTQFPLLRKATLPKMSVVIFAIFITFFLVDMTIKSRYVLLPTKEIQEIDDEKSVMKQVPIELIIDNSNNVAINAVQVMIKRKRIDSSDKVVFDFFDAKNNKLLLRQGVDDYYFPQSDDKSFIFLKKPVRSQKIKLLIYKQDGKNDLVVRQVKTLETVRLNEVGHLTGFSSPIDKEELSITFVSDANIYIKFRGSYPIANMISSLKQNFDKNATFFTIYLGLLVIVFLGIVLLSKNLLSKKQT